MPLQVPQEALRFLVEELLRQRPAIVSQFPTALFQAAENTLHRRALVRVSRRFLQTRLEHAEIMIVADLPLHPF